MELISKLAMIEDLVLSEVHDADWHQGADRIWRPQVKKQREQGVKNLREFWRSWCNQCKASAPSAFWQSLDGQRLWETIQQAEKAVSLEIGYRGGGKPTWTMVFDYERALRPLRELLTELDVQSSTVRSFKEEQEKNFVKFRQDHGKTLNVFVAITYDDSDEVFTIRQTLKMFEHQAERRIKFHYAEDENIVDVLYSNLKFYMIACDATLVFFTKSNPETKGTLHNPNVAFEFGYVCGLGKKCLLVLHESVNAFTDVQGLLFARYKQIKEVENHVERFLKKDLGVKFTDLSAARPRG